MHKSLLAGVALMGLAGLAQAADPGAPGAGGMPRGRPMMNIEDQFKAMDTNHDGKLSAEEYVAGMAMMRQGRGGAMRPGGGPPPPGGPIAGGGQLPDPARMKQMAGERFKAADTNHDGFLSLDEFKAEREKMMRMRQRGPAAAGGA
jgi:Ca2+-binding EF-hand superfamily protein